MLIALLLLSSSPCDHGTTFGGLGADKPVEPASCDSGDIEITRACHCTGPSPGEKWGSTKELVLEMQKSAKVKSGETIDLPFTLTSRAASARTLDFSGASVVYEDEVKQNGKRVPGAPCGALILLPKTVRLTLQPGKKITGTVSWRAANYQGEGCADLTKKLSPGKYKVTFSTRAGEPPLKATVDITVQ